MATERASASTIARDQSAASGGRDATSRHQQDQLQARDEPVTPGQRGLGERSRQVLLDELRRRCRRATWTPPGVGSTPARVAVKLVDDTGRAWSSDPHPSGHGVAHPCGDVRDADHAVRAPSSTWPRTWGAPPDAVADERGQLDPQPSDAHPVAELADLAPGVRRLVRLDHRGDDTAAARRSAGRARSP